jgi:hypothetical protein
VITNFKTQGMDSHDVGEAVYRISVDPAPRLQYLIMRDDQWPQTVPILCRLVSTIDISILLISPLCCSESFWSHECGDAMAWWLLL